ncbi:MAG: carbon-nitrogen hydrolase [Ignavibacteria bacterium]|nr:carbon-nitrogen hydrolase [Ignavibacteria bacterium]
MKTQDFTIGVLQLAFTPDPKVNEEKTADFVRKAADKGAQVICLPELYRSQYFCQKEDIDYYDLAEPIPGPSTELFSTIAKEKNVVIIVPIFEHRGPGMYHNSAAIMNTDGSIAGTYRKMHIPDDPSYYEKFYFTPGDMGFKAVDTKLGKIGTLICWDQWFPEAARIMALQGVPVLFYPTAIGWHPAEKAKFGERQLDAWTTVQRGHAVANGLYVAAANRIGLERPHADQAGIQFWGSSFISDPQGVILAKASTDKEEILLADISYEHLENVRRNWPYLRDRRIDAYSDIIKRYID